MPNALTVAGSDAVGGAGLQADLKAFEALGIHACSVVTCVTSQNTKGVSSIFPIPPEEVGSQLESVLQDVRLDAVKTGMLYSADIVKVVATKLKRADAPIVVDPVMAATTGSSLHKVGFVEALISKLLPMATLVTPNLNEASRLSGIDVKDEKSAKAAAAEILELGPRAVLVKGGHLKGPDAADYLCTRGKTRKFASRRVSAEVHGTGCSLASLIAGHLAQGRSLENAVKLSKDAIYKAILSRETVGSGVPCANPLAILRIKAAMIEMVEELDDAAVELEKILVPELVPEVGCNMGYGVLGATEPEEVAAYEGRIVRVGNRAKRTGCARFGASKHVARIVLAASSFDPEYRCALNLKYSEDNVLACRKAKLSVSSFSRSDEPEGVSSMTWGVTSAIGTQGKMPDVVFDEGGQGKEPMIRLLGKSPEDVLSKLRRLGGYRSRR